MDMTFATDVLHASREVIGLIGVIVIATGAMRGMYQFFMSLVWQTFDTDYIRLQVGNTIILGLEFIVGADIIGSLVTPSYYNVGLLGIIVVIRIVLTFFLSRELRDLSPEVLKKIK
jgi:uncharacterized membrane protein